MMAFAKITKLSPCTNPDKTSICGIAEFKRKKAAENN
jgi:hypothetical protein